MTLSGCGEKTKALFVSGTGTDVGKTVVSSLLFGFLTGKGLLVGYQKWVSTGGPSPTDLLYCLEKNGLPFVEQDCEKQVVYRFDMPASPHLAAEMEKKEFDAEKVRSSFDRYAAEKEFVVVEGVGGVLVPLRRDLLLADFLTGFQMTVLVVAKSGLGTINHTLLTIESLRNRHIPVLGVIFSDEEEGMAADDLLIADNMRTIAEIAEVDVFGRLPRLSDYAGLVEAFQPVGEKIWQKLL